MTRPKALPVRIIVDVHERQSGIADTLRELGAEVEIATSGGRLRGRRRHARRTQAHAGPSRRRAHGPPLAPARQVARRLRLPVPPRRGHRHRPRAASPQRRSWRVPGCDRPGNRAPAQRLPARLGALDPPPRGSLPGDRAGGGPTGVRQRPRPKPGDETAEALLAAVPGISTTSARALLERFGARGRPGWRARERVATATRECPLCEKALRRDALVCARCRRQSEVWTVHDDVRWARALGAPDRSRDRPRSGSG
jgi:hypothetical protein